MTQNIHNVTVHSGNLKRAVCLFVLLASFNAMADTPDSKVLLATNDACRAPAGQAVLEGQTSSCQPVDPYEAIKWRNATRNPASDQNSALKTSTYTKSAKSAPADTRRVFKDDFERVLTTVGNAKNTEMIWLRSN